MNDHSLNNRLSQLPVLPSFYSFYYKSTINAFKGATRCEIALLNIMYMIKFAPSYRALKGYTNNAMSTYSLFYAINNCIDKNYITRIQRGRLNQYYLTQSGIDMVNRFNAALINYTQQQLERLNAFRNTIPDE